MDRRQAGTEGIRLKLSEQFSIEEEPARLWKTLQQAELVASCVPGVESVEVLDPDNINVRISQAIGPMSATFDARVRVVQRIDGQ
jgi:carbon monoxide dehydrogenase subunit G